MGSARRRRSAHGWPRGDEGTRRWLGPGGPERARAQNPGAKTKARTREPPSRSGRRQARAVEGAPVPKMEKSVHGVGDRPGIRLMELAVNELVRFGRWSRPSHYRTRRCWRSRDAHAGEAFSRFVVENGDRGELPAGGGVDVLSDRVRHVDDRSVVGAVSPTCNWAIWLR